MERDLRAFGKRFKELREENGLIEDQVVNDAFLHGHKELQEIEEGLVKDIPEEVAFFLVDLLRSKVNGRFEKILEELSELSGNPDLPKNYDFSKIKR